MFCLNGLLGWVFGMVKLVFLFRGVVVLFVLDVLCCIVIFINVVVLLLIL